MSKKIDYFELWEKNKNSIGLDGNKKFILELVDNIHPLKSIDKPQRVISRTKSDILRRSEITAVKNELSLLRTGEIIFRNNVTSNVQIEHRKAQIIYIRDILRVL